MTRQGQATAAIVNAVYINSSKIICNFSSISVGHIQYCSYDYNNHELLAYIHYIGWCWRSSNWKQYCQTIVGQWAERFSLSNWIAGLFWNNWCVCVCCCLVILCSTNCFPCSDIPARLYNCSAITKDCSTCVKTSLLLELECHWCPSLAPVLSCSSSNTACSAPAITNSNSCPLPTIL